MELPLDNQGAGDSVSPPLRWSWTGDKPKSLKTYVVIAESQKGKAADTQSADRTTNWLLYDIPDSVDELREELSGDGASSVGRLGMKEGSEQAPVIVDPMGGFGGYKDPEIEAMEDMVHNAMDASYEDANRAKEGKNSFGDDGYYHGPREGTEITFRLLRAQRPARSPAAQRVEGGGPEGNEGPHHRPGIAHGLRAVTFRRRTLWFWRVVCGLAGIVRA